MVIMRRTAGHPTGRCLVDVREMRENFLCVHDLFACKVVFNRIVGDSKPVPERDGLQQAAFNEFVDGFPTEIQLFCSLGDGECF